MKTCDPITELLGLLDGKVFPYTVGIMPKTAQDYLHYIAARKTQLRQPVAPQIIALSKEALAYGQDRLADLEWQEQLLPSYRLLSATDEGLSEVFRRANHAAIKAGTKLLSILCVSHLASKIYVMNQDWVQLFAWMVPALDRALTQDSRALARKMFIVLYLEQRVKHPKAETETMPMLALQEMLDLQPSTALK